MRGLGALDLVPTFFFSFLFRPIGQTTSGKMVVDVAFPALEGQLLVVEFLHMIPGTYDDFDGFREPHL